MSLRVYKENRRVFLGIGGENRRDKPYALPTNGKNYVIPTSTGFKRASLQVAPRLTKTNDFTKKINQHIPVIEPQFVEPTYVPEEQEQQHV